MDLLSDEEITAALAGLPDWTRSGNSITRTVELKDFQAAMLFTGAVAYMAEKANHHPDILIQWNKVTLTLFDPLRRRPDRRRHGPGRAPRRAARGAAGALTRRRSAAERAGQVLDAVDKARQQPVGRARGTDVGNTRQQLT